MRVLNDWLLTPARVAVHVPSRTAVVADVHLGYAEARQRDGDAVPAVPIAESLSPLLRVVLQQAIEQLVVAGDLFETDPEPQLVTELIDWCARVKVELAAVVPGNHDRAIEREARLPISVNAFALSDWCIVHGDGTRTGDRVVQGHEHPLLRWGNGLTASCYLIARNHLVLPAFSSDAAGVNVLNDSRWSDYRCCAIVGDDVLDFGKLKDIRPQRRQTLLNSAAKKVATPRRNM
jgi:putative SbcD/Mre11-related phosphoesterase